MKISGIGTSVSHKLATLMLGTGLLVSTALGAKAQEVKKDTFQKEMTELPSEDVGNKGVTGGLIFGGSILAYLGCLWLGNKKHDSVPNK